MPTAPLLETTDDGLACPAGGFHVDPWRPVRRAVITHAHADHARPGADRYLAARSAHALLRLRLGAGAHIDTLPFGEPVVQNGVEITLFPAGHVLGSAQVRLRRVSPGPGDDARTWVVSGDYKRARDPTAEPFETVPCDVFITESTFGLPIYRWPDPADVARELNTWWRDAQAAGRTAIVYTYALGKAQRLLAMLDRSIGPVLVHGAVDRLLPPYRDAGVDLPETARANADNAKAARGRALVVAPPSAATGAWLRKFGPHTDAFASGWMTVRGRRRRRSLDRGFVLSDHADWNDLLRTIDETGAEAVGVTHGSVHALVRYLREEKRLDAFPVATRYVGEHDETDPTDNPDATDPEDAG